MSSKKLKTYQELANERHERQKHEKSEKIALERDKFNHQKRKDIKNAVLTILVGLPIFILVITFVVIWLMILGGAR